MTLGLLNVLLILKTISGFLGFYSMNSCNRKILKPLTSSKQWKDRWFYVSGTWLATDGLVSARVLSCFSDTGTSLRLSFVLFFYVIGVGTSQVMFPF